MLLSKWAHKKIDLDDAPEVERQDFSVLTNAVDLLNHRLVQSLNESTAEGRASAVLEIGCGAYSLLRNELAAPSTWDGIDVREIDRKGAPTIATTIASVNAIPWPDATFHAVVSNQSIEHWHEYGVGLDVGLTEIRRVLRKDGKGHINFPIHLHGHRMFVRGDFETIDRAFWEAGLQIVERVAVEKRSEGAYRGWRLCGFPDFLVRELSSHEATSYVVEYVVQPSHPHLITPAPRTRRNVEIGRVGRLFHYGIKYAFWKVGARLLGRKTREP